MAKSPHCVGADRRMNDEPRYLDLRVWSPHEIENSDAVPMPLKIILDWICSYVIKPDPNLGRMGIVCPFVPPALRMNAIWLAVVRDIPLTESGMCEVLGKYLQLYESLEPTAGEAKEFKTLILIFPDMTHEQAFSLVGRVHALMKPSIVEAGLMLGEFFAGNESPGLHNPLFRPLRSPIPLLVYRQMVPNDLVFLTKPSDPPERHIQFVLAYLRSLGDKIPTEYLDEARAALAAAQSRINCGKSGEE